MFRIKDLIKEKGYTQQEFALLIETTQPNLSGIINNKVSPSLEMLQRIADALGVHITELFEKESKEITLVCPHCGNGISLEIKKEK